MALNMARNAAWLAVLFVFVFAFGMMWYIIPPILEGFYTATNSAQPSSALDTTFINYVSFKTLIIQGFYVLASMLVFFTLISSIFDSSSFQGYLLGAIAGLVVTPTVIYVISTFWNTFIAFGITFSEVSTVFVESFGTIMLINFLAGLLSFVFMRRTNPQRAFG